MANATNNISILVQSVRKAIRSKLDFHREMAQALPKMPAADRLEFASQAMTATAEEYGVSLKNGQRGTTFCMLDKKGNEIVGNAAVAAARVWYSTNITAYFKPANPAKPAAATTAVWSKIAKEVSTISRKAKKLDKKQQAALFARLAEIENEFFGE